MIVLSWVMTTREKQEDLSDFVRRMLDETGLSESDVAEKSNKGISQGYINDIKNKRVLGSGVSIKKLQALAKGFGVSEQLVIDIARGKNKDNSEGELLTRLTEGMQASGFDELEDGAKEDVLADLGEIAQHMIARLLKRQNKAVVER